ncbi:hypothetical protein O3M35_004111 [Rhynocoris fuscipes]|uniref:Uncharacterized protein n=1 Tax=Rhynocoris fuscipes TaxID=488301 RepID=A0AAW1CPR0_9HEMI
MLLVTRRYHRVKNAIRESLEHRNYTCFKQVYAVDTDGTARFADIVAFHPEQKKSKYLRPYHPI